MLNKKKASHYRDVQIFKRLDLSTDVDVFDIRYSKIQGTVS